MTSTVAVECGEAGARRVAKGPPATILVVTEDPTFLTSVHERLTPLGARVIGCMGPLASPCPLDAKGFCSLAGHSRLVIVDAPSSGSFTHLSETVPAADYASRLAHAHPAAMVLLSGVAEGSGPTGDAICVKDREVAVNVVAYSAMTTGLDLESKWRIERR